MKRINEETKSAILADYSAGVRVVQIAAKYGVATTYPSTLAARRGLPLRWSAERRQFMSDGHR